MRSDASTPLQAAPRVSPPHLVGAIERGRSVLLIFRSHFLDTVTVPLKRGRCRRRKSWTVGERQRNVFCLGWQAIRLDQGGSTAACCVVFRQISTTPGDIRSCSWEMQMSTSMPPMLVNSRRTEYLPKDLLLELSVDSGGTPNLGTLPHGCWVRIRCEIVKAICGSRSAHRAIVWYSQPLRA